MASKARLDRDKVLAVAAELVDKEGPEGLTLARLAHSLHVRPPSLYNYFSSLEQLHQSLATRMLRDMATRMREAVAGRAGYAALANAAHSYRNCAREHPGLYALTLRVRPGNAEWAAAAEEILRVVMAVLRAYDLDDAEALHASRCLRSAIHGFVSLEIAGGFGQSLDTNESFNRLIDMLDQGLHGARNHVRA